MEQSKCNWYCIVFDTSIGQMQSRQLVGTACHCRRLQCLTCWLLQCCRCHCHCLVTKIESTIVKSFFSRIMIKHENDPFCIERKAGEEEICWKRAIGLLLHSWACSVMHLCWEGIYRASTQESPLQNIVVIRHSSFLKEFRSKH